MNHLLSFHTALLMLSCVASIVACERNACAQDGSSGLAEGAMRGVYMSVALSSGYDTAINSLPNVSGGVALGEWSLSKMTRHRKFNLLLEQDTKIVHSFDTGLGLEHFERTAASFTGETSRRTKWSVMLENGFGSDAARATGSLTASSLSLQMPDENVAVLGTTIGSTLNDHASIGTEHQLSRDSTIHFAGEVYIRHFFQTGENSQQYSVNSSIDKRISPRLMGGIMGEAVQQIYSNSHCITGSLSPAISFQANRVIGFVASAGPIIGSEGCANGYIYSALLSAHSAHGSELYLGSSRRVSNGYIADSTWEELTYGGAVIGRPKLLEARFDGGYAVYGLPATANGNKNLQGFFVSGELRHRLSPSSELSVISRFFSSGANQGNFNRSLVLLSYTWSRQPNHSSDRNLRGASYDH